MSEDRILKSDRDTMDELLFFPNNIDCDDKEKYENIFLETWKRIPQKFQETILGNLEFILCKRVEDWLNSDFYNPTRGIASLSTVSNRCFIVFNPFPFFSNQETHIHFLSHELAHIYYNHPKDSTKVESTLSDYEKEEREKDAFILPAEEWGIHPHQDDIPKLYMYRKYVLHED